MPKEIERKFLVNKDLLNREIAANWKEIGSETMSQYYLVATKEVAVRLRTGSQGTFLTIKYNSDGISSNEEELAVSYVHYVTRVDERIGRVITKTRYRVPYKRRIWEVDVFREDLEGLVVAEIECADAASITDLPPWVTTEVTFDHRFKNAVLATSDEWKEAIA